MSRKWSEQEIKNLETWFEEGVPDAIIGKRLNRTKNAVKTKRQRIGIIGDHANRRLTDEARRAMGRKPTGKDSWSWKGGRRICFSGYVEIHRPEHHRARGNGYVFEHILVAEEKLGRKIKIDECVHHLDGNKQNNYPDNLKVMKRDKHTKQHPKARSGKRLACPVCGKHFYVKPSHISLRTTCSRKCAGSLFRKYYQNNPRDMTISSQAKEKAKEQLANS